MKIYVILKVIENVKIKQMKRKRKCKQYPPKYELNTVCEVCKNKGGKCFARNKYIRNNALNHNLF